MASYTDFIAQKRPRLTSVGRPVDDSEISDVLFPFQRALVRWAVPKGRAALLPDAGMGKTPMQLEWARLTAEKTLILAPLTVARQTVRMAGELLGLEVTYAREQSEAKGQLSITNYEMMHRFDPSEFGAVVLDESSILKATEGVYRNRLVEAWANTRYRLCCTATPAPNDIQEITNHSAFLGVMPRRDVLATFFTHASDDARASGWRLKPHARQAFWRWMASWGMALKKPSDLGFSDEGYELPPLHIRPAIVEMDVQPVPDRNGQGRLFMGKLHGVTDRAQVRRQTARARVGAAVDLVTAQSAEPWIVWCGLNDEQDAVTAALGDDCISVYGSMPPEQKAELLEAWQDGQARVLVTKTTIAGFGMNMQRAARMAFVGLSDSYEQYYQAVRRCWRFGQSRPVEAYIVLSDIEREIFENVVRKEREAEVMAHELVKHVASFERAEIAGDTSTYDYRATTTMEVPAWLQN